MTTREQLEIEQSELREVCNTMALRVAGGEELTDEEKTDLDTKGKRLVEIEPALRAAIQADEQVTETIARQEWNSEQLELIDISRKATLTGYITQALQRGALEGPEKELNEALNMPMLSRGINFPTAMLSPAEPDPETGRIERADAVTSLSAVKAQSNLAGWIRRLFRSRACSRLGVTFESAMVGERTHAVVTGGSNAATVAQGASRPDTAKFTMSVVEMAPNRLTGAISWQVEDLARLPGLEAEIRNDVGNVFVEKMESEIWNGNAQLSTNGLLAGITNEFASDQASLTAAGATAATYRTEFAKLIDGLYAEMPSETNSVLATSIYTHIMNLAEADLRMLALDTLKGQGWNISSSLYVDATAQQPASGKPWAISSKARGRERTCVAAAWPSIGLILDEITQAAKGEVILTLLALWDFAIIRQDNWVRHKRK